MTARHQYGPHRPEDAPNSVTVLSPSRRYGGTGRPVPQVRALPPEVVAQRAARNELARARAAGEGYLHDCPAKGHQLWTPDRYCVLCRQVIIDG